MTNTMQKNCPTCSAKWKKAHQASCPRSMKYGKTNQNSVSTTVAPSNQPITKRLVNNPPVVPAPVKKLTNRIALVIDASGSMKPLTEKVTKMINEQIGSIKVASHKEKQHTYVSVYDFSDSKDIRPLVMNAWAESVQPITNYSVRGMTALRDAIGRVVTDLAAMPDANDPDTSFLVIVMTDGEENASSEYSAHALSKLIDTMQKTDRWTFVMNVPPGHKQMLTKRTGVPEGNIREWEGTVVGLETANQVMKTSNAAYFASRSLGATSSQNYFTTNLTGITQKNLEALQSLDKDFYVWEVKKEEDITSFVETQLKRYPSLTKIIGTEYQPGRAYYQLTKREKVQSHKDLIIRDNITARIYGGAQARQLIGMPVTGTITVTPGNHGNFSLFVKSTSSNRKLVRGTKLLYKIT